jgi:putative hydrolase of the HAD superfamily
MQITIKPASFFIFDLDDTLYPEIDFLRSGFKTISETLAPSIGMDIYTDMWQRYRQQENVFQWIVAQFGPLVPGISTDCLLKEYREHLPDIKPRKGVVSMLQTLAAHAIPAGLITDGRSITQRNKLKALQIEHYFTDIIISEEFGSEKPDERNYLFFTDKYPGREFYFVGDNTAKDFIVPARLGWQRICIRDDGTHIHAQDFGNNAHLPTIITAFDEIQLLL